MTSNGRGYQMRYAAPTYIPSYTDRQVLFPAYFVESAKMTLSGDSASVRRLFALQRQKKGLTLATLSERMVCKIKSGYHN
jgi:hypothetical protein